MIAAVIKALSGKGLYIIAGAVVVAALWAAWTWQGSRNYEAGREYERQQAEAAARQIDAEWRKRERQKQAEWDETYAQITKQRGAALAAAADAAAAGGSLREQIANARARAAEAARAAGRSERAATAAWDVLQECRAEYQALAAEAERVLGIAWATREYSQVVSKRPE